MIFCLFEISQHILSLIWEILIVNKTVEITVSFNGTILNGRVRDYLTMMKTLTWQWAFFSPLWSGCCISDALPVSILNYIFMYLLYILSKTNGFCIVLWIELCLIVRLVLVCICILTVAFIPSMYPFSFYVHK